jgi:hypothetical protein
MGSTLVSYKKTAASTEKLLVDWILIFFLGDCSLEGSIPSELGRLEDLEQLDLGKKELVALVFLRDISLDSQLLCSARKDPIF